MGHAGLGRELEGLFPVEDLLPSNVPLDRGCWIERKERGGGLTELLTKGGYLRGSGIS